MTPIKIDFRLVLISIFSFCLLNIQIDRNELVFEARSRCHGILVFACIDICLPIFVEECNEYLRLFEHFHYAFVIHFFWIFTLDGATISN